MLQSWHREMPDYNIQSVEQAEYQMPQDTLGEFSLKNGLSLKNPLLWITAILIIFTI